jgi:hypothetical protein
MASDSSSKENSPVNNPGPNGDAENAAMPVAAPAASKKGKKRKAADESSKSTKVVWKNDDDKVLVETLLKEREEGRQSDSGFKPASWTACADALKGSELKSGGIAKTANSCHDHWNKVHIYTRNILVIKVLMIR